MTRTWMGLILVLLSSQVGTQVAAWQYRHARALGPRLTVARVPLYPPYALYVWTHGLVRVAGTQAVDHRLRLAWTAWGLTLCAGLVGLRARRERPRSDRAVTRWATRRMLRKAGLLGAQGVVLGRIGRTVVRDNAETHTLVVGPTRCHAPGTKILMGDGTVKCIEDITVGEQVMGPDSQPRTVLELHTGIGELARISPTKGEPFTVTMDHRLSLRRTSALKKAWRRLGEIVDVTVWDWMQWSTTRKAVHKLYRVGVEFPAALPVPVPPYLLGVLLGDGDIGGDSVKIINPDAEVRTAVERLLPDMQLMSSDYAPSGGGCPVYGLRKTPGHVKLNPLREHLNNLGLRGCRSGTKFIPQMYKTASRAERLLLLAGLLDTDGYHDGKGGYEYSSKSVQLAADVAFVVRSLGLAAYVSHPVKRWQNGEGVYWLGMWSRRKPRVGAIVKISGDTAEIPCCIPRKQAPPRRRHTSVCHVGFTVERTGAGPYYGFTCDGDQRYLMADFTVTHNSGKGENTVIPTLLSWQGGAIVYDPKNELFSQTAAYRRTFSTVLHCNPTRLDTQGCNLLAHLVVDGPTEHRDTEALMTRLADPDGTAQDSESPTGKHFRELTIAMGQGLVLYALRVGHTTLPAIAQLLYQTPLADLAAAMLTQPHAVIQAAGRMLDGMDEQQLWGVVTTVQRAFKPFLDPGVGRLVSREDVDLHTLRTGSKPVTIYYSVPFTHQEQYRGVTRLFFHSVFDAALASLIDWKHRQLVLLDEVTTLRRFPLLADGFDFAAGYGIKMVLLTPSLNRIIQVHGPYNNFFEGAATRLIFPPNTRRMAAQLAPEAGEQMVTKARQSQQVGTPLQPNKSVSTEEAWEPLLTATSLAQMSRRKVLLLTGETAPAQLTKIRAWRERPWRQRRTPLPRTP